MSIKKAVEAYKQSAYQGVEYRIDTAIVAAELPIFGGIRSNLKALGNSISRPFKVTKALFVGGEYPTDNIVKTEIPADIKNTPYGDGLNKMRDYGRSSADKRAEAFENLLHGKFKNFFREEHAVGYNSRIQSITMPGEGIGPIDKAAGVVAGIGANLLEGILLGGHSSTGSLGGLSAPATPLSISIPSLPMLHAA